MRWPGRRRRAGHAVRQRAAEIPAPTVADPAAASEPTETMRVETSALRPAGDRPGRHLRRDREHRPERGGDALAAAKAGEHRPRVARPWRQGRRPPGRRRRPRGARAQMTATFPLPTSSANVAAAAAGPAARRTLVEPMLPLPTSRTSSPRVARPSSRPKGIEPIT